MKRRAKVALAGTVIAAVAAGVAGTAYAGGEGPDRPITGTALEQATKAALASTGGGRVTGTEDGDEESAYEVEVTLDDGREVDVQLDAQFAVVGSEAESAGEADEAGK